MSAVDQLIGESPAMAAVREQIRQLVSRQQPGRRLPPILLEGETGSGKGLLASVIHREGPRREGPFVDVNCAAIPETLLEAELFGFERGAFTDARQAKPGLFQTAHGGTIFLDEIALLPAALQAKLLKVIEERQVRRLGSTRSEPVDAWVLTATNEDLRRLAGSGRFREDLYHRLAVLTIRLPPLRDRSQDVLVLAEHFLARACADYGLPPKTLAADAQRALVAYRWPGNIRELSNVIERVALLVPGALVRAESLGLPPSSGDAPTPTDDDDGPLGEMVETIERRRIMDALQATQWNISQAAARLGISRNKLRYRVERYALRPGGAAAARRVQTPAEPVESTTVAPDPVPPSPAVRWERRVVAFVRATVTVPGSRHLEVLVEKAQSFGAHIEELGATGMVAAFGFEPTEDAGVRAALAAMAMLKGLERAAGSADGVRLSLHAGEFMVGQVGDTMQLESEARRQAWKLLEELQAHATPNTIVASHAARARLRRQFEFVPLARGTAPRAYRVLGYEPSRFAAGPFVGRGHDLDLLRGAVDAADKGHGQLVSVVGDAGVGKSRLFSEFRRRLRGEAVTFLHGRCESYASAMPFLPVQGVLRGFFAIDEGDDAARITDKVKEKTLRLDAGLAPALLPLLALLDVPIDDSQWRGLDASRRRQRTLEAVRRLLLRESERQPLVLALEDLQWIDADTQALLDQLVRHLGGASMLVLLNYRPDYHHTWSTVADYRQLRLTPLLPEDARELLADLLGDDPGLDTVKALLIERTEGNPFFLEETVWTLAETGVLSGDHGAYRLARQLQDLDVPESVRAVVAARIGRLSVADRTLLQTAAVIGRTVPLPVLHAVSQEPEERIRAALARLEGAEFLYESTVSMETAYTFRQALTLEVAYQSIVRDARQALHRKVCRALEHLAGDRIADSLELLAYHAVRGEAWDRATRYVYLAGEQTLSHARDRAGVALYEAAVEAVDDADPALRVDAYLDLWAARVAAGALDGLRELAERTDALATSIGDNARLARVRVRQAQAELSIWPNERCLERALERARDALTLADAADLVTRGEAYYLASQACRDLGRSAEAIDLLREGIALLSTAEGERPALYATLCGWRAEAEASLGEFENALASATEALETATAIGSTSSIALAHAFVGAVQMLRGDADEARSLLEAGLTAAEADEIPHGIAANALYLAHALALAGDHEAALRSLARALDAGASDAFMTRWTRYRTVTAAVYLLAGRLAEADAETRLGESLIATTGARGHAAALLRLRGDVHAARTPADMRSALGCYEESLAVATELGMSPAVADAHARLASVWERARDRTQAHRHATVAARLRAGMGMPRA